MMLSQNQKKHTFCRRKGQKTNKKTIKYTGIHDTICHYTQVKNMTREFGIKSDTELFTMLHFYHDLGVIIYFGGEDCTNGYLQDMVILDPQWLIDIFKRIITVLPDQEQVCVSPAGRYWGWLM